MTFVGLSKRPKIGTLINFICQRHQDKGVQQISWSHFKSATKICKYCCGKNKSTMDFKKELHLISPMIEVIGEYKGSEFPILCRCKIDGNEWSPIGRSLLYGNGCPVCGENSRRIKRKKTIVEFINEMSIVNPDIEIIGKYVNNSTKIKCKCKNDGHEWHSVPYNLLNKTAGCPECAKKRMYILNALSNEEFLNRLSIANPTIDPLEEYSNFFTKLKCRCKVHNSIFYQTPHGMLSRKNGCSSCTQTSGEKIMNDILTDFGFNITHQHSFTDCVYKNKLKFDAFDLENNIAYEFNGEQHYRPVDFAGKGEKWANKQFEINKIRDNIKIKYCNDKNISLIIVPHWEKDNMEYFLFDALKELNVLQ